MPICIQVLKIYGARKKRTEADKCQGYFFNKEIMGFAVNNCFREQRPQPVSSAPVCFKRSYLSLLGVDGTKTESSVFPAVISS